MAHQARPAALDEASRAALMLPPLWSPAMIWFAIAHLAALALFLILATDAPLVDDNERPIDPVPVRARSSQEPHHEARRP